MWHLKMYVAYRWHNLEVVKALEIEKSRKDITITLKLQRWAAIQSWNIGEKDLHQISFERRELVKGI